MRISRLVVLPLLAATVWLPTFAQESPSAEPPDDVDLNRIVVTGSPFQRTLFDLAQPASVLEGNDLQFDLKPTLGDTLANEPGVSSSYFGPGASRPIIRGFDGDRIRVLQNGVGVVDASTVSVDHNPTVDPLVVERIEVVRGPAVLLYGPNTIGGVVNVIDNRIPMTPIEQYLTGRAFGTYSSAEKLRAGSFVLESGYKGFNLHVDGFKRASLDYDIPGFQRSEQLRAIDPLPDDEEQKGTVRNSATGSSGLTVGGSYAWDKGYLGVAGSGYNTRYGTIGEPEVTIGMQQRRLDVAGEVRDFGFVESVKFKFGYSDYEHTEYEGDNPGTKFENEGFNGRLELAHKRLGPLIGAIGYEILKSDFSAEGAESFIPPSTTWRNSFFVFEELDLSPVSFQFGARYDHQEITTSTTELFGPSRQRHIDAVSASIGAVYKFLDDYALAVSGSYVQRPPTTQEFFADGPHVATLVFEVGDPNLDKEESYGIDVQIRKNSGLVTGFVGAFYTHFDNYVGLFPTGVFEEPEEEGEEGLQIFEYRGVEASYWGLEGKLVFHIIDPPEEAESPAPPAAKSDGKSEGKLAPIVSAAPSSDRRLHLEIQGDYVEATDQTNDDPLPRITPGRVGGALIYSERGFEARLEVFHAFEQDRTSPFELDTDAYTSLNAGLSYTRAVGPLTSEVYVKGSNLLDEEIRLATSFLKDVAPLPGRSVSVGVAFSF